MKLELQPMLNPCLRLASRGIDFEKLHLSLIKFCTSIYPFGYAFRFAVLVSSPLRKGMFVGLVLVVVTALYRLIPLFMGLGVTQPSWLPNFSPMAALCLCVSACFPRRWAIALPFVVLLGTDL